MKTLLFILNLALLTIPSIAQTGGSFAFPFLDLPYNARSASLGNDFITGYDEDVNMGVINPSILNNKMHKQASVNQSLLSGGIHFGMLSYGFGFKDCGTMSGFIKYINYGAFQRTAVNGTSEGTFRPFEMIAGAGYGMPLNPRISVGVNVNLIYSQLETYSSLGSSIDLSGTYYNEEKRLLITALVKNFGVAFSRYTPHSSRAPLPTEFQAAISYKLAHAPFRITLLAHHLNRWDLTYNDPSATPSIDPFTNEIIPIESATFFEKLARHFTYQLEIPFNKSLEARIGFDYHRRKEMAAASRSGGAGLSFGLGLHFSKIRFDYGFILYSRAGFNNVLTISTDLSKWRR